jgi:hypothetical protein
MGTETRTLQADPNLLLDVMRKQAGTLQKAVCEGTMNSIEAGATAIHIKLWEEPPTEEEKAQGSRGKAFVTIQDDGLGIKTRKEVEMHFERFGTPHDASENKTWAKFRMGRGQMFAFGKNTWRTCTFEMLVDIEDPDMRLNWIFEEGLPEHEGCLIHIELYRNPFGTYDCASPDAFKERLQEQVRFVRTPVYFNDELISVDPDELEWDFEDEHSYYQFNDNSQFKIYNLGIFTRGYSIAHIGVGGTAVSKKQLDVNFARNDILSTCAVWKAMQVVVQENKIKKAQKKYRAMGNGERWSLLRDLRDGTEPFDTLRSKRIFRTAQGKWFTWNMFVKNVMPWTFAEEGDMSADKAMEMGSALCFSQRMVREIGYDGPSDQFFDWLFKNQLAIDPCKDRWQQNILSYEREKIENILAVKRKSYLLYNDEDITSQVGLSSLKDMFKEEYRLLPNNKLTKVEKRIVGVLNDLGCWKGRQISIGQSTVAKAWTNGSTYIVFDRGWLKKLDLNCANGVVQLFTVGAHEMAHDDDSAKTHIHGPEFYEKYYEITHNTRWNMNPLYHAFKFKKYMANSRIEYAKAQEAEKEREAQKKLGLVAADGKKS